MKKCLFISLLFFVCIFSHAQNTWMKKASFVMKRERAVGFSIGDYGYLSTGEDTANNVYNDLWQYDPVADTWTQKANLPGLARRNAIAFTIDDKGYLGTGISASVSWSGTKLNDLWEYDPATNTWTQKANYPGGGGAGVYFATAFSIDSKGYICCGKRGPSNYASDLWEYKPSNDQWIQRASFPAGTRYQLSSFVVDQIAYVGLGTDENWYMNDFWSYSPGTNTWTQKNDFPGVARGSASSFSIRQRGYISCGSDGGFLNDLWQYNPYNDTWSIKTDFPGGERRNAIAFSIGDSAYLGTGKGNSGLRKNFHRYFPSALTGMNEELILEVKIFPNPFTVYAEVISELTTGYYQLTDLSGRPIHTGRFSGNRFIIGREQLPAGIYLLTLLDEDKNAVMTQRIIAQ